MILQGWAGSGIDSFVTLSIKSKEFTGQAGSGLFRSYHVYPCKIIAIAVIVLVQDYTPFYPPTYSTVLLSRL